MAPKLTSAQLNGIPDGLKAFTDKWVEITDEKQRYSVCYEDDFFDENLGVKLRDTLNYFKTSMEHELSRRGLTVSPVCIFEFLVGEPTFYKIVDYTTQVLVSKNKQPTNLREFSQFLATRILRSRLRMSTEKAFELIDFIAIKNGFVSMSKERFTTILSSIRGYELGKRTGSATKETRGLRKRKNDNK